MSEPLAGPKRRVARQDAPASVPPSEIVPTVDVTPPSQSAPPPETAPPPEPTPQSTPEQSRIGSRAVIAAGVVLLFIAAVAATPYWAPAVMQLLPWGPPASPPGPAPQPAPAQATPSPDPGIAALRARAAQDPAAAQQLGQRIAALEAKPTPDLSAIQQQLAALGKTAAELVANVAALQKQAAKPVADSNTAGLALVLLQIRAAVDLARPFNTEYQTLLLLARDHPEIAAAAQPLAGPATSGVASRAALTERLRELGPPIATAKPPPAPGWRSQIAARLRSLVTIRRIGGESQTPAEAAVNTAQHDMTSGDLAGAVAALSGLNGPAAAAAEPWLQMARQRLAVEAALHQVEGALTAALGNSAPGRS